MRFLFVGGCERSGTTLLQRLLCSHSRIVGGPEFVFTWRIADLYARMRMDFPPEFHARLDRYYDADALAESFRRFLGGFFTELAGGHPEAVFLSEKTPSNIFAARPLLDLFPDALFLHVVRDGRDVLASHRAVAERKRAQGRSDLENLRLKVVCGRWNHAVDRHFELASDPEVGDRYQLVRFEELVSEPETVLESVFGFLGLELEPAVLAPERGAADSSVLVVDDLWVTADWVGRGFDRRPVGRWRERLPAAVRWPCEAVIGRNLARLGYPVGPLPAAASRLLRRWRDRRRRAPSVSRPSGC